MKLVACQDAKIQRIDSFWAGRILDPKGAFMSRVLLKIRMKSTWGAIRFITCAE